MEHESSPAPEQVTPGTESPVAETPVAEQKLSGAWDQVMGIIPSQLHSQVTPHFREWDANFTRKQQEVHSQYAPYKQYLDNNIGNEQIDSALRIMQAIEQQPMEVIRQLTEFAKANNAWEEPEVAATEPVEQDQPQFDNSFLEHPKFRELTQLVEVMAQSLLAEREQATQAKQSQELDQEISTLTQKYGEFDQEWVLAKAIAAHNAGLKVPNLEPFVQQYQEFRNGIIANSRQQAAPPVMGGAGQADTSNQFNPRTASDADRRAMVAQRLSALAQQGN